MFFLFLGWQLFANKNEKARLSGILNRFDVFVCDICPFYWIVSFILEENRPYPSDSPDPFPSVFFNFQKLNEH